MNRILKILFFILFIYIFMTFTDAKKMEQEERQRQEREERQRQKKELEREKKQKLEQEKKQQAEKLQKKKELNNTFIRILEEDEILVKSFYIFSYTCIQLLVFIFLGDGIPKYSTSIENQKNILPVLVNLLLSGFICYLYFELYQSYRNLETDYIDKDFELENTRDYDLVNAVVSENFGKHTLLKIFNQILLLILFIIFILQIFLYLYIITYRPNTPTETQPRTQTGKQTRRQTRTQTGTQASKEEGGTFMNLFRKKNQDAQNSSTPEEGKFNLLNLMKNDSYSDEENRDNPNNFDMPNEFDFFARNQQIDSEENRGFFNNIKNKFGKLFYNYDAQYDSLYNN